MPLTPFTALRSGVFAQELIQCIKKVSEVGAQNFQRWGDGCIPPTHKGIPIFGGSN